MAWEQEGADFQSSFDKSTALAEQMKEGAAGSVIDKLAVNIPETLIWEATHTLLLLGSSIYKKLTERRDTPDVTELLKQLHRIVNEAIRVAKAVWTRTTAPTVRPRKLSPSGVRMDTRREAGSASPRANQRELQLLATTHHLDSNS